MANIKRYYPSEKQLLEYPKRYPKSIFDEYNKITKNNVLIDEYNKIINGINPNTNKKIKINGKTYNKLVEKFKIKQNGINIMFSELDNINYTDYNLETIKINKTIDNENLKIKKYNDEVNQIIYQIKLLTNWNNYIEFNGSKYGIVDKVYNNIHIENNCNGNMIFEKTYTEYIFNDRPYCNYNDKEITYDFYKCNNCSYEYKKMKKTKGGGSQYISKSGFWWK
jgi:hypothetical protein